VSSPALQLELITSTVLAPAPPTAPEGVSPISPKTISGYSRLLPEMLKLPPKPKLVAICPLHSSAPKAMPEPVGLAEPLLIDNSVYLYNWAENTWGDNHELLPGSFQFNADQAYCSEYPEDPEGGGPLWARHFLPPDGSQVPSTFNLEFDAFHYNCWNGYPAEFDGEVYLDGDLAQEFAGEYYGQFSLPLITEGLNSGTEVEVRIELHGIWTNEDPSYTLTYLVDDTATQPVSFSTVKTLY
jgi:hypothetical protein